MRYLSTLLFVALFLVGRPSSALAGKDVDCEKDLRKAVELIDERWSFKLFKPGTVDFQEAYEQLLPEAERAKTPEACADVLARFMAKLHDGHSSLQYFPDLEYTTPEIEIRSERERLSRTPGKLPTVHAYVISRDTTEEALRQILPGSEVVAVDGVPIDSLYRRLEKRVSGSTQQWKDYVCDLRLLRGPAGAEVELTLRQPSGAQETVVIQRPPYPTDEEREREAEIYDDTATVVEWKRLDGGWGYMKYHTFAAGSLDETVAAFDTAVDSLLDAPGLIIDLRGNGGGYVDAMTAAAGRFIEERMVLEYLQVREPGQNVVIEYMDPRTMSPTVKPPILARPRGDVYEGPVVVLIDRGCFSACEGFTGGLQSIGRVRVIGSGPSGGGSGWVGGLELPSGAVISFSWTVAWRPDGQQIETNGVQPDITVNERPRDWAAGRDRVLERAIQVLEAGDVPSLATAGTR